MGHGGSRRTGRSRARAALLAAALVAAAGAATVGSGAPRADAAPVPVPVPKTLVTPRGLPPGGVRADGSPTTDPTLVAPTRHCMGDISTPAAYQRAFEQRDGVWAGGDGAIPIRLPGNDVLWLFDDTILGPVLPNGLRAPDPGFVHNSFVLQQGTCFMPLLRGGPGRWDDAIPHPAPGEYFWPMGGTYDAANRVVHIGAWRLREWAPGTWPGPNRFQIVGFELTSYAIDGLRYLGRQSVPSGFANRPGDVPYGATMLGTPSGTYLYGCNTALLAPDRGCYVARADADLAPASWRYWSPDTPGGWSTDPGAAVPMTLPQAPLGQVTVIRYGTGYLASSQDDGFGRAGRAWYSDQPTGPWLALGTSGDVNASIRGPVPTGWMTYGARVVDLPGAGLVTAYSVNTEDDLDFIVGWAYGPRFVTSYATGPGRGVAVDPAGGWYSLDGYGHVVPHGGATSYGSPTFTGWDIARDIAVMPDGQGYVVLDGWGGVHRFGSAAALPPARNTYWPGWDIARSIVITPDGRGYVVLDGLGGLHAAGTAIVPPGAPYWPRWDIARSLAITADGTGYYVLDGLGGVHAVGARYRGAPSFGWDIARSITTTAAGYAVLDGLGGLHRYGDAPAPLTPPRAAATWAAVAIRPDGRYVVQRRVDGGDTLW